MIMTPKEKFLSEFETKYFRDSAKDKIFKNAAALEGGIVLTAENATGVGAFGMWGKFSKSAAGANQPTIDQALESKKGFTKK